MLKRKEIAIITPLAKSWSDFALTAIKMMPDLDKADERFLKRYFQSVNFQRKLFSGRKKTQQAIRKQLQDPTKYYLVLQTRALILSLWIEWLERNIIALTAISVTGAAESERGGALHQARAKLMDTLRQLHAEAKKERAELLQEIKVWEKRLKEAKSDDNSVSGSDSGR